MKIKSSLKDIKFLLHSFLYKLNFISVDGRFYEAPTESERLIVKNHGVGGKIPKIIWMYWDSASPPPLVIKAKEKICDLNKDHVVNLLSKESLGDFLPDLIDEISNSTLCPANLSDYIRLSLLSRYGGIWVDASTLCYKSFSWVHESSEYDLHAYFRDVSTLDKSFPIIESWFLAAPKGNHLISLWLDIFRPAVNMGGKEYFLSLSGRSDYDVIKQNITSPEYLIVYLAQQIALRECNFSLNLKRSEDSAFYFQRIYGWDVIMSAIMLMIIEKPKLDPELIKLTSMERRFISFSSKMRLVHKRSFLAEFL